MRNQAGFLQVAAASVVVFLGVLAPSSGRANTITQTVSLLSPGTAVVTAGSASFSQFDQTLGTLTEIAFEYSGSVTFIGGNYMYYYLYDPTYHQLLTNANYYYGDSAWFIANPNYPITYSETGALLAQYIGLGTTALEASVSKYNATDAVYVNGNAVITYTYTPATTPLPAALPLFATGLGMFGLFAWRRKKKAVVLAA